MSAARRWLARLLPALLFLAVALAELRNALARHTIPGAPLGEGWGRLYVTAQVGRWLRGEAAPLHADLIGWPEKVSFWPTDPLLQLLAVPLSALLGDTGGLTALTLILAFLAGFGPWVLARTLGATPLGAAVAGLIVQLAPYLTRNLADLVLEVEAVGLLALAGAAMLRAARAVEEGRPAGRSLALAGLGVFALAASSPYYAVYLALVAGMAALLRPRAWRASLRLGLVGALACGLALAPLALAEGGQKGRLGPQYQGRGYHPSPGAMVHASGRPWEGQRAPEAAGPGGGDPVAAPVDEEAAPEGPRKGGRSQAEARRRGEGAGEPRWKRVISRLPGGGTALLALAVGLVVPASRPVAALALLVFLIGPGPGRLIALAGLDGREGPGLAQELLRRLPLTNTLGNPTRVLAPFLVLAAAAGGLAVGRRAWMALGLGALVFAEAWLHQPRLAVPATRAHAPQRALEALRGPTIVFPSGDPPLWHPGVAPKEVLTLAGRAGVPVAYDYGRGRPPADLRALVRLSAIADAPLGDSAFFQSRPLPADRELWPSLAFESLLVLEDRLTAAQLARLRDWLEAHATLLAEQPGASAWSLPDRDL